MGLLIDNKTQARRHGAYVLPKTPPQVIRANGSFIAAIVEQFPWGPAQTVYKPTSIADRLNTFAPPGMDRTGAGYLSMIAKGFTELDVVRVTNSSAVAASATLNKTGPTAMLTATLNSVGTAGNSVTWATSAATDGNSNHFNLAVTVTGASGTTIDLLENLNYSGTGADSIVADSKYNGRTLKLLGTLAKLATGVPIVASGTFSSGADGTVVAGDYVGTAGTGDKGLAKLEGRKEIRHFFTGDPGNSLRAAVNAGIKAHAHYMGNRCGYINGDSGQTAAQAQTDVASYRDINVFYIDPWVYIRDDVTATKRLVSPASFAASVGSQLSPSTSIAWKNPDVRAMLGGIVELEADRGDAASTNEDAGIVTLIAEETGGFTMEAGVNTNYPADPDTGSDVRSRMLHYIGSALVRAMRPRTDGPNVPKNQQDEIDAAERFIDGLVKAKDGDPDHTPHLLDGGIGDPSTVNTDDSLAHGEFEIPIEAQVSPAQKKIFFGMLIGETVKVRVKNQ